MPKKCKTVYEAYNLVISQVMNSEKAFAGQLKVSDRLRKKSGGYFK